MAAFHEFPKMLYRKKDGAAEIHGVPCETIIAADADEEGEHKANGFVNSPAEAAAPTGEAPAPAKVSKKKG